ncbi:MAG: ABC transporter ATP-binding protein [Planctomycetaceae bacterium]|nr:MAG: ABC transporter ATP-binding protein [Planctomycetaceae bacterium]
MKDGLVVLDKVSYGYSPERPVLARCSFQLDANERVGLVGTNGSGKTTVLKLIVGLLKPTSGHVRIFGQPCCNERDFREVRRRVGFLFQDSDDQLFCPTVAEDVAFGPLNMGKSREEVRRIVSRTLSLLGLGGFETRITYKLSGGEKRMVALAAVLAMLPEVLLLDEPTAGLDDAAAQHVVDVLAELPQAMVLATHDPRLLGGLVNRSLRLTAGRFTPESSRDWAANPAVRSARQQTA